MSSPGRMFQDAQFEVVELIGRRIESIGYLSTGPDSIAVVFLKPAGGSWNRGFLDCWFAVWDDHGGVDALPPDVDEESDITFVDLTDKFANRVIRRVFAHSEPDRMPRLEIVFEDGARLSLRVTDEHDYESDRIVSIHPPSTTPGSLC